MPAPGRVTAYSEPSGPGVRMDSGIEEGATIGGQFDSMLAKLIVTGESREQALQRSARALEEYVVEGLPTVIPFHQEMVTHPEFAAADGNFTVYTRWIEEDWDNQLPAYEEPLDASQSSGDVVELPRENVVVEIDGQRVEITVPGELMAAGSSQRRARRRRGASGQVAITGDTVASPMQGTVIKVDVSEGQEVSEGDALLVLEAMKMENAVKAHKSGVVKGLSVHAGQGVTKNEPMLEIVDPEDSSAE